MPRITSASVPITDSLELHSASRSLRTIDIQRALLGSVYPGLVLCLFIDSITTSTRDIQTGLVVEEPRTLDLRTIGVFAPL